MEASEIDLKQYGIDVGLLISGLFGAILLTSKGSAMNLGRTLSSLVGGAASANYITPVIVSVAKLDNHHFQYSIAFILGYLGLRSIEYVSSKFIFGIEHNLNPVTHTPVKTTKRNQKPRNLKNK